ncbi:MAG: SIMPL domain-containing protein [Limisphaerales bacterium]
MNRVFLGAVLFLISGLIPLEAQRMEESPRRNVITVTGSAETSAPPDRAVVRLGAETQSERAEDAQAAVNKTMQQVIENIKGAGIPARAIQTTGLQLFPVYEPHQPGREGDRPVLAGYRASNTVQVQVDDLKVVGSVIDAGLKGGANQLQGISFELKDDSAQKQAALRQAVREARAKAEAIADAADRPLGPIVSITETEVGLFRPQGMMAMERAGAVGTPVEPGELRVNASVTVQFQMGGGQPAARRERRVQ